MYQKMIEEAKYDVLEDIKELVLIESVRDEKSATRFAPFGTNIRTAMDSFLRIAEKLGFRVHDEDGYAVSASLGTGDSYIGILGHLDIVESGDSQDWDSNPFEMDIRNGVMYGRGVNDDKGPLIGALYAAKMAHEINPNHKHEIRVIAGGAEETTWECMDYYFKKHTQPIYGFSPDGNFPIVNGEMGVLQLSLVFDERCLDVLQSEPRTNFLCHTLSVNGKEYKGDKILSRNPHKGKNAIFEAMDQKAFGDFKLSACYRFIETILYRDEHGKKSGLFVEDKQMAPTTVCLMSLNTEKDGIELCLDIRYPKNDSLAAIQSKIDKLANIYGFNYSIIKHMKPLYVEKDSHLIHSLQEAYETVMEKPADVLTKSGASYARVLDCGVAFGATFEGENPRPHLENECMPIASLLKAMEIYAYAIEKLIEVEGN